ncbi:hypothetical protein, partial [Streptomyces erythrochromogenes]|uniref:hypothetical protein n=1 Tax=Streptomyces erythrochromogenes TaxID=285574 RepID=UPI00381A2431
DSYSGRNRLNSSHRCGSKTTLSRLPAAPNGQQQTHGQHPITAPKTEHLHPYEVAHVHLYADSCSRLAGWGSPCGGFLVRVVEPESGGRGGVVVVGQVVEVVDAVVVSLFRAVGGCFGAVAPIAAHELVEGVGEAGFVLLGVTVVAVDGLGADVLPGAFVERPVDVVAVDPRNLGEFAVGEPDPDLADVVGVVVDLPFPAAVGDGGGLAAVRGDVLGSRSAWSAR